MSEKSMLRVANWGTWQSYRSDRGQPPWIKVHRQLLRNVEWVELTDAQRGQLVAIWLLAADHNGAIPASAALIKKLCFMTKEPDLNLFIQLGFLETPASDATMTPERRHDDVPKAEESRTEEKRDMSSKSSRSAEDIFEHWKTVHEHPKAVLTSKRRKLIRNALKDYSGEDLCKAISGYRTSPHHMGKNNNGTIYDSIELLLRDAKHIEAGLDFGADPPDGKSRDERRAETSSLAEMLQMSPKAGEEWDDFEERVRVANERRIAGLTGTASTPSSSRKSNGHGARTREG